MALSPGEACRSPPRPPGGSTGFWSPPSRAAWPGRWLIASPITAGGRSPRRRCARSRSNSIAPLRTALREIAEDRVEVVLFTNANQVENVMQVARESGLLERVRAGLARAVVGSVGPISTQSLKDHGVLADLEPDHPKMGPLVREASLRCHLILDAKRGGGGDARGGGDTRGGGVPDGAIPDGGSL